MSPTAYTPLPAVRTVSVTSSEPWYGAPSEAVGVVAEKPLVAPVSAV